MHQSHYTISVDTHNATNPLNAALKSAPMAPASCSINHFKNPVYLVVDEKPMIVFNKDVLDDNLICQIIESEFIKSTILIKDNKYSLQERIVFNFPYKINSCVSKNPNVDLDENVKSGFSGKVYFGYIDENSCEYVYACVNKEIAQIVDPDNSKDMVNFRDLLILLTRIQGFDYEPLDMRKIMTEGLEKDQLLSDLEEELLIRYNKSTLRIADKETFSVADLGTGLFRNGKIVAMCTSKHQNTFDELISSPVFMNFLSFNEEDDVEVGEFDIEELQSVECVSIVYIDPNDKEKAPDPIFYYFEESVIPLLLSCTATEVAQILDNGCPDIGSVDTLEQMNLR